MSAHPDRTPRLDPLHPRRFTTPQRAMYDAITGGPRAGQPFPTVDGEGRLLGPFDALLRAPDIGRVVQDLGAALRFSGSLSPRMRELAILTVAAHWDSDYEWYAHTAAARHADLLNDDEIAWVRSGEVPPTCSRTEAEGLAVVRALLQSRQVTAELHGRAQRALGEQQLVELLCVTGYYWLLAALLETFAIPAPGSDT